MEDVIKLNVNYKMQYYFILGFTTKSSSTKHHEESPRFQDKFFSDVKKLYSSLSQHGNPFMDRSDELVNIITNNVMNEEVIQSYRNLAAVGEKQHKEYINSVIAGKTSITDTLSKVGMVLFSSQQRKGQSKQKTETALLKQNLDLAHKLWMTASVRGIAPEDFFTHENNVDPPSIAFAGQLRSGEKSDFLPCLESVSETAKCAEIPCVVTAGIIDAPALFHMISPDRGSTFEAYRDKINNHGKQKLVKVYYLQTQKVISH